MTAMAMVALIQGLLDGGHKVAIELFRDGWWVVRVEVAHGCLAAYTASGDPRTILVPPHTPFWLRLA